MRLPGRLIRGPIHPDRWAALRFVSLRWAALPVIDRRWTAPLSAIALGFGIFVGAAIGPGSSLGSQTQTVVEVVRPAVAPTTVPDNGGGNGGATGGGHHTDPGDGGGTPAAPTPTPPTDNGPFGEPTPSTPPTTTTPPPTTTTTTTTTPTDTDDQPDEPPPNPTVKGTVVHVNDAAGSYTVAREDGTLRAVHADGLPGLGAVITVTARALANGTFGEVGDRESTGDAGKFDLAGTVTFSEPRIGAYTVSATGTSVLVRVPAGTRMPEVGDHVIASVRIAGNLDPISAQDAGREGCGEPPHLPTPKKFALQQVDLAVSGHGSRANLEAVVEGVCRKSDSLILSADDQREAGRDIAVVVPASFAIGDVAVGQMLAIRADIGTGGNLTASKIAADDDRSAADDANAIQP
jgi:hypothetical protein